MASVASYADLQRPSSSRVARHTASSSEQANMVALDGYAGEWLLGWQTLHTAMCLPPQSKGHDEQASPPLHTRSPQRGAAGGGSLGRGWVGGGLLGGGASKAPAATTWKPRAL